MEVDDVAKSNCKSNVLVLVGRVTRLFCKNNRCVLDRVVLQILTNRSFIRLFWFWFCFYFIIHDVVFLSVILFILYQYYFFFTFVSIYSFFSLFLKSVCMQRVSCPSHTLFLFSQFFYILYKLCNHLLSFFNNFVLRAHQIINSTNSRFYFT